MLRFQTLPESQLQLWLAHNTSLRRSNVGTNIITAFGAGTDATRVDAYPSDDDFKAYVASLSGQVPVPKHAPRPMALRPNEVWRNAGLGAHFDALPKEEIDFLLARSVFGIYRTSWGGLDITGKRHEKALMDAAINKDPSDRTSTEQLWIEDNAITQFRLGLKSGNTTVAQQAALSNMTGQDIEVAAAVVEGQVQGTKSEKCTVSAEVQRPQRPCPTEARE